MRILCNKNELVSKQQRRVFFVFFFFQIRERDRPLLFFPSLFRVSDTKKIQKKTKDEEEEEEEVVFVGFASNLSFGVATNNERTRTTTTQHSERERE